MKSLKSLLALMPLLLFMMACNQEEEITFTKPTPEEYESSTTNPDYVPVDWETTTIHECRPDEGIYTFERTSETSRIVPGSVLAIDLDTTGYIVIVKDVVTQSDKVSVNTVRGSICDIFANYIFWLSTMEDSYTRVPSGVDVYTPTSIIIDGKKVLPTRGQTTLTEHIWDWGENFDNEVLYSKDNLKVYLREAGYSASLDVELSFSFGQRTKQETIDEAFEQYRSEMLMMDASVVGQVKSDLVLQADIEGKIEKEEEEDDLWKQDIFKPISMKFVVQGIPVYITLGADLYRGASFSAEGKMSFYTGFRSTSTGRLGFGWQQSSNKIYPQSYFERTDEIIYPTIEGQGKITGEAYLYPRLHLLLYGLLGPTFDIKPYLGCEVKGGFRQELLGSSDNYCAWQLRSYAGINAAAGLSMEFMNHDLAHINSKDINVVERTLYESPTDITFTDALHDKVRKGETNHITFSVFDTNHLLGQKHETPLPQIVKFEGKGALSSPYGIVQNGKVQVDWTPSDPRDILKAILYNAEGGVIRSASFGSGKCSEPTEGRLVDLGLSVKWAGWNIGASSPEGFGDYYSWGETSTKSDYSLANYEFFEDRPDRDYITEHQFKPIGYEIQGTEYDVAHVKWGEKWRMPTYWEFEELRSCEWHWITYNGVEGELFVGPNGNAIFLPQAGRYISEGISAEDRKKSTFDPDVCSYWTGTYMTQFWGAAYMYGYSHEVNLAWHTGGREEGYSVRAVWDDNE